MKRMMILGFVILFWVPVVFWGCATVPVKPITQEDLADLKGKWKGFYQDRKTSTYVQPIELEIEEIEDYKAKGKTIWSHADRPPTSIPFYGKIENGRLVGGYINLSLRKGGGKMKLEGEYRIQQWEGTVSMNKIN